VDAFSTNETQIRLSTSSSEVAERSVEIGQQAVEIVDFPIARKTQRVSRHASEEHVR
jgi:hypothetical protein